MAFDPGGRREVWSAGGLAVVAAVYLLANRHHPLDTLATPGPGLFPVAAGGLLLLLSIWHATAALRRRGDTTTPVEHPSRDARPRAPLVMAGVLGVYAAALPAIGFLPSSFVLVLTAARLMGLPGWWRPAALALGVTAASHVIFAVWLRVPLPPGRLR